MKSMNRKDDEMSIKICSCGVSNTSENTPLNPLHYNEYKIEPWDFIMANDLPFWLGNVIKYSMRAEKKGGKQDIDKAITYLEKSKEFMK